MELVLQKYEIQHVHIVIDKFIQTGGEGLCVKRFKHLLLAALNRGGFVLEVRNKLSSGIKAIGGCF
jgi:hypothetical protein